MCGIVEMNVPIHYNLFMAKLVHLEIHSKDIDKAKTFFSSVFGWEFDRWGGPKNYWLLKNENEYDLKVTIIDNSSSLQGIINTIEVISIDETVEKIKKLGGKELVKKTAIENTGYISYVSDLDGNVFGLVEKNSLAR